MVAPDPFPNPGGTPPLLYHTSGLFTFTSGSDVLTGDYVESVFLDITGTTCPTCLDFAIEVDASASSTLGIERVGLLVPLSISADAGYVVGTPGLSPTDVNRGSLGAVSFFFNPPLFPGGSGSDVLLIATTATAIGSDSLGLDAESRTGQILGGIGVITTGIVGPAAVPEPGTGFLLALGLVGFAGSKLRSKGLL